MNKQNVFALILLTIVLLAVVSVSGCIGWSDDSATDSSGDSDDSGGSILGGGDSDSDDDDNDDKNDKDDKDDDDDWRHLFSIESTLHKQYFRIGWNLWFQSKLFFF